MVQVSDGSRAVYRVEMVYGSWACFVPVQDELAQQLSQHHLHTQLRGIGERLKSMVKVEEEDGEEDMSEGGLGWDENVEGDEVMEEVEVEEERKHPDPFHNTWTKRDMEALKAGMKEGKEKDVEVVESEEEDEEQGEGGKGKEKKFVKGGGKSGGKMGGEGRRVLAPWAKQKKVNDWVVKVDDWGGKRFNSGWYHYKDQWYPILVRDKVMVCFSINDVGPFVNLPCSSHGYPCDVPVMMLFFPIYSFLLRFTCFLI